MDDAQHAVANERASSALKLAELGREISALKMELERRQAESLRREALLQKSRDELASNMAAAEREASAALAAARDDESSKLRRLEAERARLNEMLLTAQSEASAQPTTSGRVGRGGGEPRRCAHLVPKRRMTVGLWGQ